MCLLFSALLNVLDWQTASDKSDGDDDDDKNLILLIHFESWEVWSLLPLLKIALIKQADHVMVFFSLSVHFVQL